MFKMAENTRMGSIKQEILDLKNEFTSIITSFKDEMHQKFESMNNRLNTMENSIKSIISDQVNESIMQVKNSVIEALKEDNLKMQRKVETLEEQLAENDAYINKLDQYNRRNNTEIIEGCHRLGKANPQNTIVRLVNRKFCHEALEKKGNLKNVNNHGLGFEPSTKLLISENLTPLNQQLAWMCRELKQAGKIHSCWSLKGVVRLRRTMNERGISITNLLQIKDMYPDFVFKEKLSRK